MCDAPVAVFGVRIDGEAPLCRQDGAELFLLFGARAVEGHELGDPFGIGRACAVCLFLGMMMHPAGLLVPLVRVFSGALKVVAEPENATREQPDQTALKQLKADCSLTQCVQGAVHVYSRDGAGVLRVAALSRCAKSRKAISSWGSNCNWMRAPGFPASSSVFCHANC